MSVVPSELPRDVRSPLQSWNSQHNIRPSEGCPACGGPVMKQLVLVGRLIFGAWMLANGANYFFGLWAVPAGHEPLAIQLMNALVHSGLLGVAMTIQLLTGALLLAGLLVPVALCVVMPISTCALYWER